MKRLMLALVAGAVLISGTIAAVITADDAEAFPAGSFFVNCALTKTGRFDPLTRQNPSPHEHMFFGNLGINANSTTQSLRAGATNCSTPEDKSAYWAPTFMRNGQRLMPYKVQVYYISAGRFNLQPFPDNLVVKSQLHQFSCGGSTTDVAVNCGSRNAQYNVTFKFMGPFPEVHAFFKFNTSSLVGARLSSDGMVPRHGDFFPAWTGGRLRELINTCLNGRRLCGRVD